MDTGRQLATLAEQIDLARRRVDVDGNRSDLHRAIVHSLRTTSLAISTGLDPRSDAAHMFIVLVSPAGEHLLLQGGLPVPMNATHLSSLFSASGIELVAGQMLLLEPELAKEAIEEALRGLSLQQALTDHERRRILEALDDALTLPPQGDLEALRVLEIRSEALWERKIELSAASLVAEEYLQRARTLAAPDDPESEVEAA